MYILILYTITSVDSRKLNHYYTILKTILRLILYRYIIRRGGKYFNTLYCYQLPAVLPWLRIILTQWTLQWLAQHLVDKQKRRVGRVSTPPLQKHERPISYQCPICKLILKICIIFFYLKLNVIEPKSTICYSNVNILWSLNTCPQLKIFKSHLFPRLYTNICIHHEQVYQVMYIIIL